MSSDTPSRRDILRPVTLLAIAFGCALFAGVITLVSMGAFQQRGGDQIPRAIVVALIVAGITFIVVLLGLAMLMLVVDPAEVQKTIDRPVLYDPEPETDIAPKTKPADDAGSGPPAAG